MICVVIKGPTFEEAYQQISQASVHAECVELRLDCFEAMDFQALKDLRGHFSIPMIFTLRSRMQGGVYPHSEENRLSIILQLVELNPDYLDLENHVPHSFIEEISSRHPHVKLILSYHNFEDTPEDLERIYREMQKISAFFYKISVTSKNCLDALRLACWASKHKNKLIAISMGMHGQLSRILGPIWGCPITYAALEENQMSAPGQLSAKVLLERYHHHSLTHRTAIYGLIGDPVTQSVSDETHNSLMATYGIDAVYIKIQVKPEELSDFLQYAKQLSFQGLSVTMPLKEKVIPMLDEIDPHAQEIGAVNTLYFHNGKICGFNTDGIGALNAIEREYPVKGKRIVMIGSGGAAKAIAYEAHQRGGLLTIVNRDVEKAHQLAQRLEGISKGLDEMRACVATGYDILINCTPVPLPIDVDDILPQAVAMDITTKPKETMFLKHAMKKGCQIIFGYRMFVEQALGQFHIWFKNRFDIQEGRKVLEKEVEGCLSRFENIDTRVGKK